MIDESKISIISQLLIRDPDSEMTIIRKTEFSEQETICVREIIDRYKPVNPSGGDI
jgi:hypothetical protein